MYENFFKRGIDFLLALTALLLLFPVLLVLLIVGAIVMKGNPIFVQPRPGRKGRDGKERIFYLLKLRSMSSARDADGKLLPDERRLGKYGKLLRASSLDELPSLLNILKGDMALVGPRPQLVRDMVFMTEEQRRRHDVRPGLTGLAQINGRNNISWEKKFEYDLEYVDGGITALKDLRILWRTVAKVFKREDTVREGTASDLDFGDWLLQRGSVDEGEYWAKQEEAKERLRV